MIFWKVVRANKRKRNEMQKEPPPPPPPPHTHTHHQRQQKWPELTVSRIQHGMSPRLLRPNPREQTLTEALTKSVCRIDAPINRHVKSILRSKYSPPADMKAVVGGIIHYCERNGPNSTLLTESAIPNLHFGIFMNFTEPDLHKHTSKYVYLSYR